MSGLVDSDMTLLPCPFCGEETKLFMHGVEGDFFLQCKTCTTTGPNGIDKECAVIQWNQREVISDTKTQ